MIERGDEQRDRFWNDWAEAMLAGGISWLLADRPGEERKLSALFDLFNDDDVDYSSTGLRGAGWEQRLLPVTLDPGRARQPPRFSAL
jgi:hypothetical protein